jgi:hypothetical protein
VSVSAHLVLARGVPALVGRQRVLDLLEAWLHPTRTQPLRFGRTLFASEVVAFLESLDVVDRVASFALADADGVVSDPVEVDPDYGLVASSGAHALTVEEGQ